MNEMHRKPFLVALAELLSTYWPKPSLSSPRWSKTILPTPGNVVFTVLVLVGLFWAQSAGALPLAAPSAASTGTIAYQGRLADTAGAPLTGTYNMTFRLYSAVSGGAPLWEELWNGANSVQVSDGLFNVMLGSLTPILQSVVAANSSLFLGITVGTDSEMSPRVQLGSVPFAVQALTVPDGSVTTEKIADGAVTSSKLPQDLLKAHLASSTVTNWSLPSCGSNAEEIFHKIPGVSLNLALNKPTTALMDFSGVLRNEGDGQAIHSVIFVDDHPAKVTSGGNLIGGCRQGIGNRAFAHCNASNTFSQLLDPGNHVIDVRVACDGSDGGASVWLGVLRVVELH